MFTLLWLAPKDRLELIAFVVYGIYMLVRHILRI
jgi:hypothetical protein